MIRFNDVRAMNQIGQAAEVMITPFVQCISWHDSDGVVAGGALFDGFNQSVVYTHVAGFRPNWANPAWLYAVSDFCFNHLKVRKVLGIVSVNNEEAIRFDKAFGFKIVATVDDYFPNGAAYLMELTRADCRFLNDRYRRFYDRHRLARAA